MKTKFVVASVVALAAMSGMSAAFAENEYMPKPIDLTSNTTRAQVRAEYLQARKDGTLPQMGDAGNVIGVKAPQATTLTRAEVRAQAIEWAKTHHTNMESGYGSH
jgi:Domain of unknown function (DUF4148)